VSLTRRHEREAIRTVRSRERAANATARERAKTRVAEARAAQQIAALGAELGSDGDDADRVAGERERTG
jgi:hypothetical protein